LVRLTEELGKDVRSRVRLTVQRNAHRTVAWRLRNSATNEYLSDYDGIEVTIEFDDSVWTFGVEPIQGPSETEPKPTLVLRLTPTDTNLRTGSRVGRLFITKDGQRLNELILTVVVQ
jgi:hypothetical protein